MNFVMHEPSFAHELLQDVEAVALRNAKGNRDLVEGCSSASRQIDMPDDRHRLCDRRDLGLGRQRRRRCGHVHLRSEVACDRVEQTHDRSRRAFRQGRRGSRGGEKIQRRFMAGPPPGPASDATTATGSPVRGRSAPQFRRGQTAPRLAGRSADRRDAAGPAH